MKKNLVATGGAGVVLLIGLLALRLLTTPSALDAAGQGVLQQHLYSEYLRADLEDGALDTGGAFLRPEEISFRAIEVRGTGEEIILRVEVEPHPLQPADLPAIRYFRARHSLILGWQIDREVEPWAWHLAWI